MKRIKQLFLFTVILCSVWAVSLTGVVQAVSDKQAVSLPWLSLLLGQTVSDVIQDVDTNDYVTDSEVVTDVFGRNIALTKLMIAFKPNATPSQLTQLLKRLNATITSSVARTRSVVVRIPQPASLSAYITLIAQIEAEPYIDFVWWGEIPRLAALPSNYQTAPPDISEIPRIDNHLAIRAHAAWNAAGAIDTNYTPQVVVADSFGEGKPINNTINYTLPNDDFATGLWEGGHGYAVLGIIAGTHGQYYTTGIYPKTISLGVIDHPNETSSTSNRLVFAEIMNKLLITLTRTPGKVVVNTSIGYSCDGAGGDCIDIAEARKIASIWTEYVRLFGLESRVLHVTAAGNIDAIPGSPGLVVRDTRTKSPFASAARLSGLTDGFGRPMANLTNTIVIENAVNRSVFDPPDVQPIITKCLFLDSFIGGNLSGIGTHVMSFDHASGIETTQVPGTSFAAPQVSGLAAFVWAINHALTPQQIKSLLIATSDPVPVITDQECSDWAAPAPIVDAYGALLALDAASIPTASNAPVRYSILDVNEDGIFDEIDLQVLVSNYYDLSGPSPQLIVPTVPDYGRYDLNGDGWTGGNNTAEFDLDRVGSAPFGLPSISRDVTQNIMGSDVHYNENQVTDHDIMCYYAYSGIYTGDTQVRDNLIGAMCGVQNCVYQKILATSSQQWSYMRSCLDPVPTKITYGFDDSPYHPTTFVRLELCADSSYDLYNSTCPVVGHEDFIQVGYLYDVSTDERRISLWIWFLNSVYVNSTYVCDPTGELIDSTGVSVVIGDFGNLSACHAALKGYIPGDPSIFDYPGDCHSWWDRAGEVCTITAPQTF